jgi:parvulin-like peptidyl-prolyl isomerase
MNFKKYTAAIMVGSFLLSGCSSNSSAIRQEDGKDIVASLTDKDVFADDILNQLLDTNVGRTAYYNAVLEELINTKFPVDDAMRIDADMIVENTQAYYKANFRDNADEQLESYLASNQWDDLNDFRDAIIKSLQNVRFLEHYVNENYEEVFNDYYTHATPRVLSIIKVNMIDVENPTEEENAKLEEINTLVHTSKDFNEIASEYSDDSDTKIKDGRLGVVDTTTDLSSYGNDFAEVALSLGDGEISEPIKGTGGYFILKCNTNKEEDIKSRIQHLGIDSPLLSYDNFLSFIAFNSYTLTYESDEAEEIITEVVNKALEQREENRREKEDESEETE